MSEQEFKFVIDQATHITGKVYSEKRIAGSGILPRKFIWLLGIAYIFTGIVLFTMFLAMYQNEKIIFMLVSYSMLGVSAILAITVMLLNYFMQPTPSVTYAHIVKKNLE